MKWKKAIVIRAFADSPGFLGGTEFLRSLDDFSHVFHRARGAGFDGVQLYMEISKGILSTESSEATLNEIGWRAREEGVSFPTLEIAPLQYSLISDDAQERAQGWDVVRRALDAAKVLGSPGVLVIPGGVGRMWDSKTDQLFYEDAYQRSVVSLREIAEHAEKLNLIMLVEPIWNMFLLSPLEMRCLIDEVGRPSCGVLLDTGNVTLFGFAEQWIRILGSRIQEIHMKDFRRQVGNVSGFVPLLAGDVNWPAVTSAARAVNFSGYWIAEQFPYLHHGDAILQHTSYAMDRILAAGEVGLSGE